LKILVYISMFLFISGCKVTGDYFIFNGFSSVHFTIKKDSTFIYQTFSDAGGGSDTIKGRWTTNNGMIFLNSSAKPKFIPNTIYEKAEPNKNKKLIIIKLMDVDAFKAIISINNGREIDTLNMINDTNYLNDFESIDLTGVYTHLDSVKNIRILKIDDLKDCLLEDSVFKISNPSSNVIIIYAQPYNHYWPMKYFVNTEWKLHNSRIYPWRKTRTKFDRQVFLSKKKTHLYKSGVLP
jgi:hypothetical protein